MERALHVGQRIIKSAVAVFFCFLIYMLRGEKGIPFYSAIAAILCMQPYVENSGKVAKNRIFGTFDGAFYGLVILCLYQYFKMPDLLLYFLISLCIIPVIKTAVWLHKSPTAYFSCVVFLSIVANHITDEDPFIFVLNRVIDTLIGILLSLVINSVHLPRRKNKDVLFISGLDDTLLNKNGSLTPYSLIELNRIIADGANFTVSTERTPASLLNALSSIHFNLPVIAMNGAVLYDIESNRYVHTCYLKEHVVKKLQAVLQDVSMGAFYNVIRQDTLLIYLEDFQNDYMQKVYQKMRKNPLRNYICDKLPDEEHVVYLYVIDTQEKIDMLEQSLLTSDIAEEIRLVKGYEKENEAAYLKIYDKDATREKMNAYLAGKIGVTKIVTYGSIKGRYDVLIQDGDDNKVVRSIKKMYEPFILDKR